MQDRMREQAAAEDILDSQLNPLMHSANPRPKKDLIFFATKPIATSEDLLIPENNPLLRKRSLLDAPKDIINLLAEKYLPNLADRNAFVRTCSYFNAVTQKGLTAKRAEAMPGLLKNKCLLLVDRYLDRQQSYFGSLPRFGMFRFIHHHTRNNRAEFYQQIKTWLQCYDSFRDLYNLIVTLSDHLTDEAKGTQFRNVDYALICLLREILITAFSLEFHAEIEYERACFSRLLEGIERRFMRGMLTNDLDFELRESAKKLMLLGCFDAEILRYSGFANNSPHDVSEAISNVQAFYQDTKTPVSINPNVPLRLQSVYPAIYVYETYHETNASFNKSANEAYDALDNRPKLGM